MRPVRHISIALALPTAAGQPLPVFGYEIFLIEIHIAGRLHFLDIGAGREGLFIAGDDQRADVRVGFESIDGIG